MNAAILSGDFTFQDKESLVRIVIKDKKGEEFLLYEAFYPLYLPGERINLGNIEEVDLINGIMPDSIKLYVNNTSLYLDELQLFEEESEYFEKGGLSSQQYLDASDCG